VGFATAVNLGLAAAETPYVAVVNDDAVVEPGWLRALTEALEAEPRAAAAQGVNLAPGEPATVDGWGLAWNRWLQAVQLGRGAPPPALSAPPREAFGVSATAALYRREALLAVDLSEERRRRRPPAHFPAVFLEEDLVPPPIVFDPLLGSYYEDADLATRLRAAGWTALSVPAARARHAGAATAGAGTWRWRHVYGNRWAVAARLLGRAFWRRLPRMALRDLADLAASLGRGDLRRAAGVVLGWVRAARLLPAFARTGPPLLAPAEMVWSKPFAERAGASPSPLEGGKGNEGLRG
jgi:GT2 family glycosyltransferase